MKIILTEEQTKKARLRALKYIHSEKGKKKLKDYRELHKKELSEWSKAWRNENKDRLKKKQKEYYLKNRERLIKAAAIYKRKRNGPPKPRLTPEEVKEHHRISNLRWAETHKEHIKAVRIIYEARTKDKRKSYRKEYAKKNREKILARLRLRSQTEKEKERKKLWCINNPDLVLQAHRKRRAKLKGVIGADYTTHDLIKSRCEMFGNKCWMCGGELSAIDHVKPISRSGSHMPCNLRPICLTCNSMKNNRWINDRSELTQFISQLKNLGDISKWKGVRNPKKKQKHRLF